MEQYCLQDWINRFHLTKVPLIESSSYPKKINRDLLGIIQGIEKNGETSTYPGFHLPCVHCITNRIYTFKDFFVIYNGKQRYFTSF